MITSFAGIVRTHGRERPDHPAIEFEGTTVTFGQLDARSSQLATALAAVGVEAETRVAFLDKNGVEFFETTFLDHADQFPRGVIGCLKRSWRILDCRRAGRRQLSDRQRRGEEATGHRAARSARTHVDHCFDPLVVFAIVQRRRPPPPLRERPLLPRLAPPRWLADRSDLPEEYPEKASDLAALRSLVC